MCWGVAEFFDAKTAFEARYAIKPVIGFVLFDDAPKVIAFDAAGASITHGFEMKKWCAGKFSAEFGTDAVMVRSFVAVENHEILGQNLALILRSIEDSFAVRGKSGKLLLEKILRESDEIMPAGGLELDFVEFFDVGGVGRLFDGELVFGGLAQGAAQTLAHTF